MIEKIKAAMLEEKSSKGFAAVIEKLSDLGILRYEYNVERGVFNFHTKDENIENSLDSKGHHVSDATDKDKVIELIQNSSVNPIPFEKFTEEIAKLGISDWVVLFDKKRINYLNKNNVIVYTQYL